MKKWVVAAKRADFKAIGEKYHIDQVTARLIRNRDVTGDDALREYLYGTIADMHDPEEMKGIGEAADLLLFKMKEIWFYLAPMFADSKKYAKKIKKSERCVVYESAVNELFANCRFTGTQSK